MKIILYAFLAFTLVLSSCKNKKQALSDIEEIPEATAQAATDELEEVVEALPEIEEEVEISGDSLFISYERSPCFGQCPTFKLEIYDSGFAVYQGVNFVDNIGYYSTNLDSTTLQELMGTAKAVDYFSLKDEYDGLISDLPSVLTRVKKDNVQKSIYDRYRGPDELHDFYDHLDAVVKMSTWAQYSD